MIDIVFVIAILIMSVVVHEVSHGYTASILGDDTARSLGRLTLNPFKHLEWFGSLIVPFITSLAGLGFGWAKPVPYNPDNLRNRRWGELLIAGAGPLSNIGIALVFALIINIATHLTQTNVSGLNLDAILHISMIAIYVNCSLAIFNLIPIPPLDGSKILFAFLPNGSFIRESIERYGLFLIILFIVFGWQYIAPLVIKTAHLLTNF